MELIFDFEEIFSLEDFYKSLHDKIELPAHFGDNLDALNDYISGGIELPLTVKFINLSLNKLERFEELIQVMEELDLNIEEVEFSYFIQNDF